MFLSGKAPLEARARLQAQVESLYELEGATGGEVKVSHLGAAFLGQGGAEATTSCPRPLAGPHMGAPSS